MSWSPRLARARHLPNGDLEIRAPYNPEFIAELKARVPSSTRQWVAEEKIWVVGRAYTDSALEILRGYFKVQEESARPGHEHSPSPKEELYAVLFLRPDAPRELLPVVYRQLAKLAHPDHGGDEERMKRLNAAYERLTK
jgi:hypothetical protein